MRKIYNKILAKLTIDSSIEGRSIESTRKFFVFMALTYIGLFFLSFHGLLAFIQGNNLVALVNLGLALIMVIFKHYLKKPQNISSIAWLGTILIFCHYTFLFANGVVEGTAYVWIFTFPIIAIFLLGLKAGTIFSFALLGIIISLFSISTKTSLIFDYNYSLILRVIPSYLVVTLFAFGWEKARNITEKSLKIARKEAESANRAKDEFLSHISHELRTPLNAIIGFSDLLTKNTVDEKSLSHLEAIQLSGKTLLKIINNILDLSKIEAGKMGVESDNIDIHNFLYDIGKVFQQQLNTKNLEFSILIDDSIKQPIVTDETKLRQILINLMSNAIKFTSKGKITLAVDVISESDDKMDLDFFVKDTGIGIPPDQQKLIFEEFSQQSGQSAKEYGGTGLGLSITQKFAQLLNGEIFLESTKDIGSTFHIIIRNISKSTINVDKISQKIGTNIDIMFKDGKILLYSSTPLTFSMLESSLAGYGLRVVEVSNFIDIKSRILHESPQVIMIELNQLEFSFIPEIKEIKHKFKIPIIVFSSTQLSKQESDFFDKFILKPFENSQLITSLMEHLPFEEIKSNIPKSKSQLTDHDLSLLKEAFYKQYQKIKTTMIVSDIEILAEDIIKMGKENSIESIEEFGVSLKKYAENFLIDEMMEKLKLLD